MLRFCPKAAAAVVLLAVVGVGSVHAAQAPAGAYGRAIELEQQGLFEQAASVLAKARRLGPGQKKHAAALNQALLALDAAGVYERNRQPEQARLTLEAAVKKLDAVRDVYIRSRVTTRLAGVERRLHREANKEARSQLRRARDLEQDERFDAAATAFGVVAAAGESGVSPELVQEAKLGKLRAEREDAAAEDEETASAALGHWFGARGSDLLDWIVKLLPLALALFVLWLLFSIPRIVPAVPGRTEIKLTDWSADRNERAQKSIALGRQLKAEIDAASRATASGPEVDETRDLDGSGIPGLAPSGDEISDLDAVIADDSSISIGPVAFSVAQLMNALRAPFRRRPQRELVGGLTAEGTRTIITAGVLEDGGNEQRDRWIVKAEGDNSRAAALADLALQIAVDLGTPYVSTQWRSVRDYRAAVEMLGRRDGKPEERIATAQRLLQQALADDPHNLLARFYLATVERASGRNMQSIKHLEFLKTLVASETLSNGSAEFLRRHPEFPSLIEYNKGVALAKVDDWQCHRRALEIFDLLSKRFGSNTNGDGPGEQGRLLALTRSAEASALVFELERWQPLDEGGRLAKRRKNTVSRIRAARDGLVSGSVDWGGRDSSAYVQAVAVAENAYGRALHLADGGPADAVEALENAVSLAPDFTDAWLNLASLLIDRQLGSEWAARAEHALDRALEIAPKSSKAHYLRGQLFEKRGQLGEAKDEFLQVVGDDRAAMKLAQLFAKEGDFAAAAKQMGRSLDLKPRLDFRALLYVEYIVQIDQPARRTIDDAERVAKRLASKGENEGLRRRAAKLLDEIDDLRNKTRKEP